MATTNWAEFRAAEPAFATTVQDRFQAHRHHVLATLRKDGSPRVTVLEADFRFGELWLGMMWHSRKAHDLQRDPRLTLQANPGQTGETVTGDVRVSGRAVPQTDPAVLRRYAETVRPPEPFHLFRVDLTEVVHAYAQAPHFVVRVWRPGEGARTVRRGSGAEG
ncbi:pyridoxamine 5'-phosphate oxidase family protein [Streptomyces gamaensis]|uniref:Pyridoxamine 5'-phosphate oxidase family protein n=1 Tax=Streptomyces gamaensis TaxID=1763542 RepID=A0ABW0Z7L9_9ACTN